MLLLLLCGFTRNLAALGTIIWPRLLWMALACSSYRTGRWTGWKHKMARNVTRKHIVAKSSRFRARLRIGLGCGDSKHYAVDRELTKDGSERVLPSVTRNSLFDAIGVAWNRTECPLVTE